MSAQHTPGMQCAECEGYCLQTAERRVNAGLNLSIFVGQHVRLLDYKGQHATGTVRGINTESDGALKALVKLDKPIVAAEYGSDKKPFVISNQEVLVTELSPFDHRDELIVALVTTMAVIQHATAPTHEDGGHHEAAHELASAAIAKATGAAT